MNISKEAKKYVGFGVLFSLLAIAFALLYYFKVIKMLDLYLAVIYVVYFTSIALFYNSGLCREKGKHVAKRLNFILGLICIITATTLLIYGFVTGKVSMFY